MLGSVEAGLKVIMRLEEGKNAEVDFARCSPQAAVVCLHNAPLLGPSINRQGWETLESQHCACCSVWQKRWRWSCLQIFTNWQRRFKRIYYKAAFAPRPKNFLNSRLNFSFGSQRPLQFVAKFPFLSRPGRSIVLVLVLSCPGQARLGMLSFPPKSFHWCTYCMVLLANVGNDDDCWFWNWSGKERCRVQVGKKLFMTVG